MSDVGGYHGEADAFHAYTAGMRPLAEELRGVAGGLDFADGAFSTGIREAKRLLGRPDVELTL